MQILPIICLLLATSFIETTQHHINKIEDSEACKNMEPDFIGTKLHWMCTCGVETRNNDGVMSDECKNEKELVIANQKRCASFHQKFADNYEMFFDDYNEEFVVEDAPKPTEEEKEFFDKFCPTHIFLFYIIPVSVVEETTNSTLIE